jgi:hypothetical protein
MEEKLKQKDEDGDGKREKRRKLQNEDEDATGGDRRKLRSFTSSRRRSFPTSEFDEDHRGSASAAAKVDKKADYPVSYIDDDDDVVPSRNLGNKPRAAFQDCHTEFMLQLVKLFRNNRAPTDAIVEAFEDKFPGHGFQVQQLKDKFKNQKKLL